MTLTGLHIPLELIVAFGGALGLFVGRGVVCYADWFRRSLADTETDSAGLPQSTGARWFDALPLLGSCRRASAAARLTSRQALAIESATGVLFAVYLAAALLFDGQRVEMVAPDKFWRYGRIIYHLVLITLLLAATATDLLEYLIPDEIPLLGVACGVGGAVISGDVQLVHLWFDWNLAGLLVDGEIQHGGYIPEWIRQHHHWHGLAWSAAGMIVGAGIIWLLRFVSSLLLGRESLGLGDVTLMAMIGSFIGWQPVCFVVMLAPLCGVVFGLSVKLLSGRTFIAFGPYLCLSTYLVLCTWRWLWEPTRDIFGDVSSLLLLAAVSLGGLVVLLLLLRAYRAIPVASRRKDDGTR